ncbi:MAG: LamG domain-containing protein [Candidatus Wallbacteria bacterium]|nr:LamG domain-containing protein [Candidatus Wallbacteria bacterium]
MGNGLRKGFSLIQALIAVAAGIALIHMAMISAPEMIKKARGSVFLQTLHSIRKALQDFSQDHGFYPSRLEELTMPGPGGYTYLAELPVDPLTGARDWEICKGSSKPGTTYDFSDGLICYYPMNENAGATAFDTTGNGNDAPILIGPNPYWVPGISGSGINFDGNNDRVDIDGGDSASPTFDNAFTVRSGSFWYYATADNGLKDFIYEEGDENAGINVFVSGNITVGAWTGGAGNWLSAPHTLNAWHNIVYVYQFPGNFSIYYDGVFINSVPTTSGIAAHPGDDAIGFAVKGPADSYATRTANGNGGRENQHNNKCFIGTIDEVRFYNKALTAIEIKLMYDAVLFPPLSVTPGWYECTAETLITGEILDIRSNHPAYRNW